MELNKYDKLVEKHLKENKPDFYNRLVKDNNLDTFLEDVQKHLNNYANLVEFELRENIHSLIIMNLLRNCDKYFFPRTAHKTLYCDNIFANGKTCKECVSINAYEKTVKNDPLLKKYRNKYKNLNKTLSNSNNPKFWDLYQTMQDYGPYYIQKYKHGIITPK